MKKRGIGQFGGQKLAAVLTAMIVFVGCSGRQDGISSLKVGQDGNGEGFIGQSLPISARVRSASPIDHVEVAIQPVDGLGWTFSERYTERISGNHEVAFQVGVDVPIEAEPGDYKLIVHVETADGTVVAESTDFRLAIDSTVPVASDLDVGINAAGNDLHLETELTVPGKIKQVRVEVVGDDWRDEFPFADGKLIGQLAHHFHEHVQVGEAPAGIYRVIVTVEDQQGRQAQAEARFTKK